MLQYIIHFYFIILSFKTISSIGQKFEDDYKKPSVKWFFFLNGTINFNLVSS